MCFFFFQIGSKLVILGPVASALTDFQMIRHQVLPSNQYNAVRMNANQQIAAAAVPAQQIPNNNARLQIPNNNPIINRHHLNETNNRRQNIEESNRVRNNLRQNNANVAEQANANRSNNNYDDAQNRLQRNLQLRSRRHDNDDYNLPKRFSESTIPNHISMAAFNVNQEIPSTSTTSPRERRLQSLRRMEEKIQTMRQINMSAEQVDDQPAPQKRIKRNCIGLFVCDISNILQADDPYIEWIEHTNFGHITNAPERLILSSLVAGNGELIMFGGLRKESLSKCSDTTMQVSNAMHFLQVPKEII